MTIQERVETKTRLDHSLPTTASPFLKWAGGKRKLLPVLEPLVSLETNRYFEPFIGGGALFFGLSSGRRLPDAHLNDSNADLIETYVVVRDDVETLIEHLDCLSTRYLEGDGQSQSTFYYEMREQVPSTAVARAARIIFLNKTCFNGLFRVNRAGRFNVPHGRYSRPRVLDADNLRACSASLSDANLTATDFQTACESASSGDFVYFDPPYQPLSKTSQFTSYTSADFGEDAQIRLRDCFDELTARGVSAALSNSDHPFIRELYRDYRAGIAEVRMARAINSVASAREPITELLITNFPATDTNSS